MKRLQSRNGQILTFLLCKCGYHHIYPKVWSPVPSWLGEHLGWICLIDKWFSVDNFERYTENWLWNHSFWSRCCVHSTSEHAWTHLTGIILGIGLASRIWRYNVTSSLIGRAHTSNDSWCNDCIEANFLPTSLCVCSEYLCECTLTLYVLFCQREHKHIFTFYVIPPH